MSVSAVSQNLPFEAPDSLVPRLATENAATAFSSSKTSQLHMFAEDDDSPSFWDFLDVINPLQHIPLVNDLYREVTGDKIGVGARLVGGALFGGPVGLIGSALNAMLEEATGRDAGGHLIALFKDDEPAMPGSALALAPEPNPGAEVPASQSAPADAQVARAQPLPLPDMPAGQHIAEIAAKAAEPPPPVAAPAAPVTKIAMAEPAAVEKAEGKPMALLGRQQRLMPVPPRTTPIATQSPPAVGVTVSSTGTRSYAPVTGQRPSQPIITPAMAQEMAANQTAARTANAATGEWFSASMMQGLSKYERNSRAARGSSGSVSEAQ